MIKEVIIIPEDGNFQLGFSQATIRILNKGKGNRGEYKQIDCQLPQVPEIFDYYQEWQDTYKTLLESARDDDSRGIIRTIRPRFSIPEYIVKCDNSLDILRNSLNHWLRTMKQQLEPILDLNSQDEIHVVVQTHKISSELSKNILHKLPWHWWDLFIDECFGEVALSFSESKAIPHTTVMNENLNSQRSKRVKILCILGDSGKGIDVEADRRLLRKISGAYCVFLRQPTLEELQSFLNESWDILFFAGHSDAQDDGQIGWLKINPEESLDIQTIRAIMEKAIKKGMKLAIFNSCNGLGLARKLADLDIAQIIVWREPVPDKVAQEFLKYFLESFTQDLSLYRSIREARIKLQSYIEALEVRLPKVSWLPVIHHNLNKQSITWRQLRGLPDTDTMPPTSATVSPWVIVGYLLQLMKIDIAKKTESPRESLLNRVEKFWIQGVLEKALHIEETIELGLSEYFDAVVYPSRRPDDNSNQKNKNLPEGTRAIDVFGELENTRTMLILGKPGSGKTTALLEIARESIDDARNNTTLPIPVVLNLSSWAADKEAKPLNQWLITELNRIYQFSEKQCKFWIKKQHLLLLLDGLDEVRESKRGDCVVAINQFIQDYEKTEVVVCCRIREYNKISEKLRFQTAVFYKQLTDQQIQRYFNDAGDTLSGVKELKAEDSDLQDLVKSPLTLNFIAVAYKDKSKYELLDLEEFDNRKNHLLDTYIRERFEEEKLSNYRSINLEKSKLQYSERQSRYWLSWMAQKITYRDRQELLIEHIQPDWFPTSIEQGIYNLGFRFILGIIVGLITVLHSGSLVTDDLESLISLFIPSAIAGVVSCLSFPVLSNFTSQNRNLQLNTIPITWLLLREYNGMAGILFLRKSHISRLIPGILSGLLYFTIAALMSYPIIIENIEDESLSVLLSPLVIDGVALSIFLSLIEGQTGLIDTIVLSKEKAVRYSKLGLIFGLIYVLIRLLFTPRYNLSNLNHLFDIFIELLIFTTLPGLLGLLDKGDNLAQTIIPNQGVWKSARNAALFFSIFFPVGMLCSLNYVNYADGIFYEIITIGLAVGLIAGLAGGKGPIFAGVVLIQHFTLRLVLWWQGYAPWNYARFLDYATERIFLRKVGGSYIFIHRTLQEHFAQMYSRTNH